MVNRRTPSSDVRAALVDAAVKVLELHGPDGLTVRAVATEAGVAPMGVYNHLDGKDGLVLAVLERGFQALRAAVAPPAGLSPLEALYAAGRGYRAFAIANPATYAAMFGPARATRESTTATHGAATQAAQSKLDSAGDSAFTALIDVVMNAQTGGVLVREDPTEVAMRIWSAVHGAVSLELAMLSDAGEAAYEGVLTMIVKGLAP